MHKASSLAKRWLLGTHQGAVEEAHLPAYLNEFAFRFNRRRSRSRGLVFYRVLELTIVQEPVRYSDLIANPRPGGMPRRPPVGRGGPVRWMPHCSANQGSLATAAHGLGVILECAAQRQRRGDVKLTEWRSTCLWAGGVGYSRSDIRLCR